MFVMTSSMWDTARSSRRRTFSDAAVSGSDNRRRKETMLYCMDCSAFFNSWAMVALDWIVGEVLAELEKFMEGYTPVEHGNAPPFFGGAVGYLAYDAVRQFE